MMMKLLVCVVALASIGCTDAPLPVAPGAVAVVVASTADVLALESTLLRAKLIEGSALAPLGPVLVANAPIVASVLPSGAIVVATRVNTDAGASFVANARPVLGATVAVDVAGRPALVRVDGKRALVAFEVPKGDEANIAAVLELLAANKDAVTPTLPTPGAVQVHVEPAISPLGAFDARIGLEASTIVASAVLTAPSAEVRAALTSSSPPWACALDEGAAAVLAIPPLGGPTDEERFEGRMLVAVYAPIAGSDEEREGVASVLVAGKPHGTKARDDLLEGLREGAAQVAERTEGKRRFFEVNAKRRLRAVVDDELFLLAVGDAAPVERVAAASACPTDVRPLVRVDGARLQRLLLPMLVTPEIVLRALAASPGADTIPLARLRGIERLDVDARTDGDVVRIEGRLSLAAP